MDVEYTEVQVSSPEPQQGKQPSPNGLVAYTLDSDADSPRECCVQTVSQKGGGLQAY